MSETEQRVLTPSKTTARQMLEEAAASHDVQAMLEAGAEALQTGAQADAIGHVQAAVREHSDNARLWQLLGLLNRDLQDLGPAVEAFRKAAQLAPRDAMIANGLACVSFEAGLPAAELFERAIELDPDDRALWLRLAAAWVEEGQASAVISGLEEELAQDPGWIEGHKRVAALRWQLGDHQGFANSFERAVRAAPRNGKLWKAYIAALSHDKLHERALSVIERAKSALGPLAELEAAEAVARTELGQLEAAAPLLARVGSLQDLSVLVAYLRFLILTGRPDEAAAVAESNIQQAGNWMFPYLSLCWRLLGDPRWEWLEGDPRFIGVYDISADLPDLARLSERLRLLHRSNVEPVDQSLRGGTQTNGELLTRLEPEIRQLRQALVKTIERHVAQLPPPRAGHPLLIERRLPILFSGSWSVRLAGGGRHIDHVHPAGWISSALYVSLPDESQRGANEAGWLSLGEAKDLCPGLAPIRVVEPKPGRLVLFPSTMWHGTRPFEAGERLTVAFDVRRPD
jgi:tetratricopeptide (TPR) repeat protein